jgi:hypothetical protein
VSHSLKLLWQRPSASWVSHSSSSVVMKLLARWQFCVGRQCSTPLEGRSQHTSIPFYYNSELISNVSFLLTENGQHSAQLALMCCELKRSWKAASAVRGSGVRLGPGPLQRCNLTMLASNAPAIPPKSQLRCLLQSVSEPQDPGPGPSSLTQPSHPDLLQT